jgi:hypothetical protein
MCLTPDAETFKSRPLRIRIPASEKASGVTVLIILNAGITLAEPALLHETVLFSNFLIIAGPERRPAGHDDRELVKQLMKRVDIALPLTVGSEDSGMTTAPALPLDEIEDAEITSETPQQASLPSLPGDPLATGEAPLVVEQAASEFHVAWNGARLVKYDRIIPPLALKRDFAATPLSFSLDRDSAFRSVMDLTRPIRSIKRTANALTEMFNLELRQIARQQSAVESKLEQLALPTRVKDSRSVMELTRVEVEDAVSALLQELGARDRRFFAPEGKLARELVDFVFTLETLDKGAVTPRTVRLVVPEDFIDHLKQTLRNALTLDLHEDIYFMNNYLDGVCRKLEAAAGEQIEARVRIDPFRPDEDRIRESILTQLSIGVSSRGELPRFSFLTVFSGGRRWVMPMFMLITILGPTLFGTRDRSEWAPFLIAMFLVGVGYTAVTYNTERIELIGKELENVKHNLASEIKRLLGELQRDKMTMLTGFLTEWKKRVVRRVEDIIKEQAAVNLEVGERERPALQSRLQNLNRRRRKLQETEDQLKIFQKFSKDLEQAGELLVIKMRRVAAGGKPDDPMDRPTSAGEIYAKPDFKASIAGYSSAGYTPQPPRAENLSFEERVKARLAQKNK